MLRCPSVGVERLDRLCVGIVQHTRYLLVVENASLRVTVSYVFKYVCAATLANPLLGVE